MRNELGQVGPAECQLEDGVLRQCGRVDLMRDKVLAFARTLRADDEMVLKATGNTMAIVKLQA